MVIERLACAGLVLHEMGRAAAQSWHTEPNLMHARGGPDRFRFMSSTENAHVCMMRATSPGFCFPHWILIEGYLSRRLMQF